MPRNPNVPCAGCGKLCWASKKASDPSYVPPEQHYCLDCRRARPPKHGTVTGYRKGCKCTDCLAATATAARNYARRVKERDGITPTQKARPPKPKPCLRCGTSIRGADNLTFCGPCGAKERKRSQVSNWIAKADRLAIYERDNWTCQLCGELVDRDADPQDRRYPTLDHVEPQSWVLIPDHSPNNLRTACRSCNSARGNRWDGRKVLQAA